MQTKNLLSGETIAIEFYIDSDKILKLIFNGSRYTFKDFWQKVDDAESICRYINDEFSVQFPERHRSAGLGSKSWEETFLKFVNHHLGEYDEVLDVLIRSNGEVIIKLER